jgi:hypothetical protein
MTHRNITCTEFTTLLPDYLEGALADSAVADAELHLASCEACRALVADLRAITRQAGALPALVPSRDLWPEIEARIQPKVIPLATPATPSPLHRFPSSPVRRVAIAAGLMGVTALGTWQLATRTQRGTPSDTAIASTPVTAPPVESTASPATTPGASTPAAIPAAVTVTPSRPEATTTLAEEIARLRVVLTDRADELDPATVAILESSIATIDTAITEARSALTRDPASRFLNDQLNKSLERKLGILRKAALISPST